MILQLKYEITKKISNDKGSTINAVKDKVGNLITDDKGRKSDGENTLKRC